MDYQSDEKQEEEVVEEENEEEESEEEEEEEEVTYTITYTTTTTDEKNTQQQGWFKWWLHKLWIWIKWFLVVNFFGAVVRIIWDNMLVPSMHITPIGYMYSLILGSAVMLMFLGIATLVAIITNR